MNNFKLFIETNKDKLNAFAKDYVEKLGNARYFKRINNLFFS